VNGLKTLSVNHFMVMFFAVNFAKQKLTDLNFKKDKIGRN